MTLTPAETARKVADIIDHENELFNMAYFQTERECGTVACIAGHTALLHSDCLNLKDVRPVNWDDAGRNWVLRQGFRLGLTRTAAYRLFFSENHTRWLGENPQVNDRRYSLILRQLVKELADRDRGDLIDIYELDQIIAEALA